MPSTVIPEVVVPDMRLGRQRNHDPRSRAYRYRATPTDLQSVVHLPSIPVLDQGNVGACVGFTGTELLSTDLFADVRPPALDANYALDLYHDCTLIDPYPGTWERNGSGEDTGTDGTTLGKVLVARGLASGYQHAMDPTSFLVALQTRAVPIGITWRAGCDTPNASGLIRWTGPVRGGHELLAYAYDKDRQWVGLVNHWSASWGVGGHCWIPLADLLAALADDGDATIIIPATAPAPTPTISADQALVNAMVPWRQSVISRITKAGKAAAAFDTWRVSKGL